MEGVNSTKDVKSAIMEPNGKLTILDKNSETPKFPLISNGRINYDVLELIDHEEEWLFKKLNKQGIKSPKEIFLAEYQNKELYLVPYSEEYTYQFWWVFPPEIFREVFLSFFE